MYLETVVMPHIVILKHYIIVTRNIVSYVPLFNVPTFNCFICHQICALFYHHENIAPTKTGLMKIIVPFRDLFVKKNKTFTEWQKNPGSISKKKRLKSFQDQAQQEI